MSESLLLSCRSGFENDCAAEIQFHANQLGISGFARTKNEQGFVEFECFTAGDALAIHRKLDFRELVFTRQWQVVYQKLHLNPDDRISEILSLSQSWGKCSQFAQDYPDTNSGKQLSGFCRKFHKPLQKALVPFLESSSDYILQLFWLDSQMLYLGVRLASNSSPYPMGILRLKQPSVAPSRSTLKLDEAFAVLLNEDERARYIQPGQHAVDLGACPGGWSYQLIRRSMYVDAIDNGPMAEHLMESGQLTHYREDGFKFVPSRKNVSWLVCDMVEKPSRVTRLMLKWLLSGWCKYAIFNLKLPMKKRFAEVQQDLSLLREELSQTGYRFEVRAKQLYHDREEITVFACLHRD
ncbi:23S rRNA (cytidine(2498)-2'-O)-methyltransferase RlmM [Celerinatantimonas sp. YJH-8]|uniref:23S rRNA (cytidine(2498)-2'-O)-methyltransferase RlmM n=1 Tax=Celerinatantimonas sp. YJH-8 TaxID=3228714 RepID=UPI0038CA40A1